MRALVVLCCAVAAPLILADGSPFATHTNLEVFPFFRLLDQHSAVGSSSGFHLASHPLRAVLTPSQLDSYFSSHKSSTFAIVLAGSLLTPSTLEQLNHDKHTGSIAVFDDTRPKGFSPVDKFPNKQQSLNPDSSHIWNTWGDRLRFQHLNKPLIFLTERDRNLALQGAATNSRRNFGYPRRSLLIDTFMHGAVNAQTCLRRAHCQPVGGRSVWASFKAPSRDKKIVMLTASSDADGMFYRKAPGVNSAASGTIAVLAAMHALSQIPEVWTSDTLIMSGLFTGEAFGHIGSRRFIQDVLSFECKAGKAADGAFGRGVSCKDPHMSDTSFANINASNIRSVIDVQMVGGVGVPQNAGFVLHATAKAAGLRDDITSQISNLLESSSSDFPPSSADAFAAQGVPSLVLSDFDSNYTDSFYHSRFDTRIDSQRVCDAASATVQAVLIASRITPENQISVNCSLVAELVTCFSGSLNCSLLRNFGFPADLTGSTWVDDAMQANLYASVYDVKGSNTVPLLSFARQFLNQITTPSYPNLTECSKAAPCPSEFACENHKCVQGVAFLHRAVSPGLEYDSKTNHFSVVPGTDEATWTESYWQSLSVSIHDQESSATEVGFLIFGIGLILLTYVAVRFLPAKIQPVLFGTS